jgi:hypothetical protein
MKDVPPVPLLLSLWATGLSASKVAEMLGVPRWQVVRIIEQARDIGDRRAVHHLGRNARPLGRPTAMGAEAVPAIGKIRCKYGHLRTPENVDAHSNCIKCRALRDRGKKPRRPGGGRKPSPLCLRGHDRSPENLTAARQCKACASMLQKAKAAR